MPQSVRFLLFAILAFYLTSCATRTTRETTVQEAPAGGKTVTQTTIVDARTIETLKVEWQNDFVTASGRVPLTSKYDDPQRNRELSRRGAILDAQRNLAEKLSQVRINATTTMADFSTTDFVQSEIKASLENVEVITERQDDKAGTYEVTVRMPKTTLLHILQDYYHQN